MSKIQETIVEHTICDQCNKTVDRLPSFFHMEEISENGVVAPTFDFCRLLCLARWSRAQHVATRKPRAGKPKAWQEEVSLPPETTSNPSHIATATPEATPAPEKPRRGRPRKETNSQAPSSATTQPSREDEQLVGQRCTNSSCDAIIYRGVMEDKGDGKGLRRVCAACGEPVPAG